MATDFKKKYKDYISILRRNSTPEQKKQLDNCYSEFNENEEKEFVAMLVDNLDKLRDYLSSAIESLDRDYAREEYDFRKGIITGMASNAYDEPVVLMKKVDADPADVTEDNFMNQKTHSMIVLNFGSRNTMEGFIKSLQSMMNRMYPVENRQYTAVNKKLLN